MKSQIPWSYSYRKLWTTQHRCWELHLGPLEEQCLLLTAELSLAPDFHCQHGSNSRSVLDEVYALDEFRNTSEPPFLHFCLGCVWGTVAECMLRVAEVLASIFSSKRLYKTDSNNSCHIRFPDDVRVHAGNMWNTLSRLQSALEMLIIVAVLVRWGPILFTGRHRKGWRDSLNEKKCL